MARKPMPNRSSNSQALGYGTTPSAESDFWLEAPDYIVHPPFQTPLWLLDLLRARATDEEVVATLQERVLKRESDLHEAQWILNMIGGRPGGAALLKKFVTQELITRLGQGPGQGGGA
jgi:hypothetical protein